MSEMENSSSFTGDETVTQESLPVKKKRNQPGNPDPEAEVIALSPTTLLATNRFVCEVCNKGFQRDQNLQLHRRGHNLPWKLRRPRNGEVPRKRVYICPESSCVHHDPSRALGDLTGIKKHFCRKHGEKKFKCERCSKKYAVHSDWKAHMKTCGTREYRCECGTLFSRRDSFITHRAFCDALAQESARAQEPLRITNNSDQEHLKADEGDVVVTKGDTSSSSSPPPQPLTPSTGVLSPVLSIQSSELPADNQNQTGVQLHQAQGTTPSAVSTTTATSSQVSTNLTNGPSSSKVFASVFPSPSTSTGQVHSSYSDFLCSIRAGQMSVEPMSLSLSSPIYLSNNGPALFHEQYLHYGGSTSALSATALLQKAAQMGATSSNTSFIRGLGLAMSSADPSSFNVAGNVFPPETRADTLISQVKLENSVDGPGLVIQHPSNGCSSGFTELMMMSPSESAMMFENKPPTLDFLGLGESTNGTSPNGFLDSFHSMGNGFGAVASAVKPWDDHDDRKPML